MAEFKVKINDRIFEIDFISEEKISINGKINNVNIEIFKENIFSILLNNKVFEISIKKDKNSFYVGEVKNKNFEVEIEDESEQLIHKFEESIDKGPKRTFVKAPMPGLILKLEVKLGDKIQQGQGLLILEAMKMENEIKSPVSGEIKEMHVSEKATVEKGQNLIMIE